MLSLLVAACLLPPAAAPAPAPPASPASENTRIKLAAPAAAQDDEPEGPTEKDLREAYKKEIGRNDPTRRAEAVNQYGFRTRDLPDDEAASKIVARTLKIAIEDEDLAVRNAVLTALSWGRHVDTTLDAMEDSIEDLRNLAEKYVTRPGEENRTYYQQVVQLYGRTCEILGRHPCDTSVDVLSEELRTLRPATGQGSLASDLVGPLSEALLALGSQEAVELVVRTTNVFGGSALARNDEGTSFLLAARTLHDNLSEFGERIGHRGPPFSDLYDGDWRDWFDEVEDELPEDLGKLETPVEAPPYEDPDARMRPEEPAPGERERP